MTDVLSVPTYALQALLILVGHSLEANKEHFDVVTLKRHHSKEDKQFIDMYYEWNSLQNEIANELQRRDVTV